MTENEFRDALKKSVGHTGLSSARQMKVLAGMKGGEGKVRTWKKMKLSLVLAALVVLSMGVAVAGSSWRVQWDGGLVETGAPTYALTSEADKRMAEIAAQSEHGVVTHVWNMNAQQSDSTGIISGGSEYADSVEELQNWVEADANMVWPSWLPEGYTMEWGRADLECDYYGGYVLQGWETTEDGFIVGRFLIPEKDRLIGGYNLRLVNAKGQILSIDMRLQQAKTQPYVQVTEEGSVTMLNIEGMSNAMLVSSDTQLILLARRILSKPVRINWLNSYPPDESWQESLDFFNSVSILIMAEDPALTQADLLAIFGLTAE